MQEALAKHPEYCRLEGLAQFTEDTAAYFIEHCRKTGRKKLTKALRKAKALAEAKGEEFMANYEAVCVLAVDG